MAGICLRALEFGNHKFCQQRVQFPVNFVHQKYSALRISFFFLSLFAGKENFWSSLVNITDFCPLGDAYKYSLTIFMMSR